MGRYWVVFTWEGKELLRYSLYGEGEDEREETIAMLAYENGIAEDKIEWSIITK